MRLLFRGVLLVVGLAALVSPAPACSLCLGDIQQRKTLRQDAAEAKLIVFGSLFDPKINEGTSGTTNLRVEATFKDHPFLKDKASVTIPRFIPVQDRNNPPRFVLFCDVLNDKLDAWRGVPLSAKDGADYVKGALALDPKDRGRALLYFFRFLEHADKEIAFDAFLEFAKSSDQDIGQVADKLDPAKLRGWLKEPGTPSERLGLYAFLLGRCGGETEANLFQALLKDPDERALAAYDGLLCGYIQLRPKAGWDLVTDVLRDNKTKFQVRLAAVRALRFYHGWKPDDTRTQVLRGLRAILDQGELADMAVEDLRRFQLWDLTREVLACFGKKPYDAPITTRAIVRYALSCPSTEAKAFVAELRKREAELVKECEEALQFDKK